MGAAPARFTFDLDLGRTTEEHAAVVSEASHIAMHQQAHAEGYAEGLAVGERGAAAAAAQALAGAASILADRAAALLDGLDGARARAERDAIGLAASVGRKLAAGLMAQQPAAELDALLADCLTSLAAVPHLVIRCHPDLADQLRDIAASRAAASGFSGRLIVMGDPDQRLGDGRIEWADGGLVRDSDAIAADIDARITTYLTARGLSPLEETKQ